MLETQEMDGEIVDLTLVPDLVDVTSPRKEVAQDQLVSVRDVRCTRPSKQASRTSPDVHMPVRAHFVR